MPTNYTEILEKILLDVRYIKNIEFGEPRIGHPEGKVKNHIYELEENLEKLKLYLPEKDFYSKLKFLIHVHDTFKAMSEGNGQVNNPNGHATLAKDFAGEFINDIDMLNIIQYHDENFIFWKQFQDTGMYDVLRFQFLLDNIQNWDLYLIFTIIDGHTKGKDIAKLSWFITEVKKFKETLVDETWVNLIQKDYT